MKQENVVKEGFMVKKGHIRHNWKSRWFVLYASNLEYYKSKGDTIPKGSIRLKGCSVISPDPEYIKKECVFRLIEILGTEYLLQCSDTNEREGWVGAISLAIRTLESISKSSLKISDRKTIHSPPLSPGKDVKRSHSPTLVVLQNRVTHQDLLTAMQDHGAGITLKNHHIGSEIFKMCFSGKHLVSWLLSWAFVNTREEGRVVSAELLEKAYLHPIGPAHNIDSSVKIKAARMAFTDSDDALYRFTSLNTNNELDVDFNVGMSDSSDESDEEGIIENLQATVVKQGFLVKKGQVRQNWKVRKFVLYDEPARLSYFSPTKSEKKGRIKLLASQVTSLDCNDEDASSSTKGLKTVVREHCFMITTRKGSKYILQAPSEDEMKNWVKQLNTVISKYKDSTK